MIWQTTLSTTDRLYILPEATSNNTIPLHASLSNMLIGYWRDQNIYELQLQFQELKQFSVCINSYSFSSEIRMRARIYVNSPWRHSTSGTHCARLTCHLMTNYRGVYPVWNCVATLCNLASWQCESDTIDCFSLWVLPIAKEKWRQWRGFRNERLSGLPGTDQVRHPLHANESDLSGVMQLRGQ